MYKQTKARILSETKSLIPDKWPEIYDTASREMKTNKQAEHKSVPVKVRRICEIAACLCVIIAAACIWPKLHNILITPEPAVTSSANTTQAAASQNGYTSEFSAKGSGGQGCGNDCTKLILPNKYTQNSFLISGDPEALPKVYSLSYPSNDAGLLYEITDDMRSSAKQNYAAILKNIGYSEEQVPGELSESKTEYMIEGKVNTDLFAASYDFVRYTIYSGSAPEDTSAVLADKYVRAMLEFAGMDPASAKTEVMNDTSVGEIHYSVYVPADDISEGLYNAYLNNIEVCCYDNFYTVRFNIKAAAKDITNDYKAVTYSDALVRAADKAGIGRSDITACEMSYSDSSAGAYIPQYNFYYTQSGENCVIFVPAYEAG